MSSADPEAIKASWERATDHEVLEAIANPEEYEPEAYAIVQSEVRRRRLTQAPTAACASAKPHSALWARTVAKLRIRHPIICAIVFSSAMRSAFLFATPAPSSLTWTWIGISAYLHLFDGGIHGGLLAAENVRNRPEDDWCGRAKSPCANARHPKSLWYNML